MKPVDEWEERSTLYMYHQPDEKILLVSYADKKKTGMKNVIVLTSMHNTVKVRRSMAQAKYLL